MEWRQLPDHVTEVEIIGNKRRPGQKKPQSEEVHRAACSCELSSSKPNSPQAGDKAVLLLPLPKIQAIHLGMGNWDWKTNGLALGASIRFVLQSYS